MNTLERLTRHRIHFSSPDDEYTHYRLIDAFVDNTSLAFTDTDQKMSFSEMVKALEQASQTWQQLLAYSGGSLNLKKCSWSCMYWTWINGRPTLRQSSTTTDNPSIRIYTYDGTNWSPSSGMTIRYTEPNEPVRILGVHLNPIGNFEYHINQMKKKADSIASCL